MNAALLHPGPAGALGTQHLRTRHASYTGALSASGMLWVAFFLAAWATLSVLPAPAPRPPACVPWINDPGPPFIPTPIVSSPPRPNVAPPVARNGIVVPTRMPDAPPSETPFDTAIEPEARPGGEAPGPGPSEGTVSMPAPEPEPLPAPGTYVAHDLEPEVLVRVEPLYPDLAREAGIEGTVRLLVLVGTSGRVLDVRVLRSQPMLEAAATEALRRWVFRPALAGAHPVAVWVSIPVHFTLHGR